MPRTQNSDQSELFQQIITARKSLEKLSNSKTTASKTARGCQTDIDKANRTVEDNMAVLKKRRDIIVSSVEEMGIAIELIQKGQFGGWIKISYSISSNHVVAEIRSLADQFGVRVYL